MSFCDWYLGCNLCVDNQVSINKSPPSRTVMWATPAVEELISGRVNPVSVTATRGSVTQIPDAAGLVAVCVGFFFLIKIHLHVLVFIYYVHIVY